MSSLRSLILQHSLPLLPKHSFTRQTLSIALSQCRPDLAPSTSSGRDVIYSNAVGRQNVIDTLFGTGSSAVKPLVEEWENEGLRTMESNSHGLEDRLQNRLSYSVEVGEHLVEAYANMVSPDSTSSLPLPSIPTSIFKSLSNVELPPLYNPPSSGSSSFQTVGVSVKTPLPESSSSVISQLLEKSGGRLPFLTVNPLGPLMYAWRIADAALAVDEKKAGVVIGKMNEPAGSGPEWYTSRISLGLAYLAAESHLLQPIQDESSPNPHLLAAHNSLSAHLKRYNSAKEIARSGEDGAGDVMDMLEFMGRGAIGLLRSRGL